MSYYKSLVPHKGSNVYTLEVNKYGDCVMRQEGVVPQGAETGFVSGSLRQVLLPILLEEGDVWDHRISSRSIDEAGSLIGWATDWRCKRWREAAAVLNGKAGVARAVLKNCFAVIDWFTIFVGREHTGNCYKYFVTEEGVKADRKADTGSL